jgi:tetratricopeptide (TPR) repeat protein
MPKQRHSQPVRPALKKSAATVRPKPVIKAAKSGRSPVAARPATRHPAASAARKFAKPAAAKPVAKKPAAPPNRLRTAGRGAPAVAVPARPSLPVVPSPHELAVEAFERGFHALQERQYGRAAHFLEAVLNDFPDEKELQERARVYLTICERQLAAHGANPKSLEERINAATVAINRGQFSEGLALLRKLEADYGDHDHVQYMLCIAFTVLGDFSHALEHLKHAIELNHENRYLATQDTDLDPLRQVPGFLAVLDTPAAKPRPVAKRR